MPFDVGFGLDCSRFARCYCGNPVLVSFPPPTTMLPFGGSPLREGAVGSEESIEKSHSGIPGSTAACAYPGRFAACRALRQLSSRAILQTACYVGSVGGVYWRLVKRFVCVRRCCLCVVSF